MLSWFSVACQVVRALAVVACWAREFYEVTSLPPQGSRDYGMQSRDLAMPSVRACATYSPVVKSHGGCRKAATSDRNLLRHDEIKYSVWEHIYGILFASFINLSGLRFLIFLMILKLYNWVFPSLDNEHEYVMRENTYRAN